MSKDNMSKKGMLGDVLTYVLEKTRPQVELRLEDPENSEIANIFDSSNHQVLFSKLESANLNKNDYSVFMEFYFSGEIGLLPPGVPHELLPNRENGWDSSELRSFFSIDAEKNTTFLEEIDSFELKQAWVELYSTPQNTDASEISEIQTSLNRLLRQAPMQEQQEMWLSGVCFLLRKLGRLFYKQGGQQKTDLLKENRTGVGSEKSLGASSLLEMFRKAKGIATSFPSSLVQQATFLIGYEKAVVFNYLGAHSRAVDALEEIAAMSKQQSSWPSDVIHPVLEDPKQFCSMFLNLTKSWYGKAVDTNAVKKTIRMAITMAESPKKSDAFVTNSAAVLHYYSLLSLFNHGSLSMLTDVDHPWERFKKMHPKFYSKRTESYIRLSKSPSHPWSKQLRDAYIGLVSDSGYPEQHQAAFDVVVRDKKNVWRRNLDLSNNNPLSSYDANNSSFADQINNWNAYIDMIHINQLRTTQGGSHHFDHYGPVQSETGSLHWITASNNDGLQSSTKKGHHAYLFDHYLSQSFRSSSKPKSTKMDRTNLMATILRKIGSILEDYTPKSVRNLVEFSSLKRLQKPILNFESDSPILPLHAHVAIGRILTLGEALSSVSGLLELATIQMSYRRGIEAIIDRIREQLSLEFIQLMVIVKSPIHNNNGFLAVDHITKIRKKLEKDGLTEKYVDLKNRENIVQRHLEKAVRHGSESAIQHFQKRLDNTRRELDKVILDLAKYPDAKEKLENSKESNKIDRTLTNENRLLSEDYLGFEFKQISSPKGYVHRYVNDKRAESILATLSSAPWWKYDLATLTEEELAQTMVNWIRHRANEPPIPLIHPRSRGGK